MGPVNQIPLGTIRVPPPFADKSLMALAKAVVLSVIPSGFPS